jgi:DNA-binding NtrC family response regulator
VLHILVVEDEPELLELLAERLREAGHQVQTAADGAQGLYHLRRKVFDLMLCDIGLPVVDGLTLFRQTRKDLPSMPVILMTGSTSVRQGVSALKEGAYDYLTKPFDIDELLLRAGRLDETRALRRALTRTQKELAEQDGETTLIGESPGIFRVLEMSKMVSQSDAPVLIVGDSGTGKEVVARLIRQRSARQGKPFVAVNCGALPEQLLEAELFGYEPGAFTGAANRREGRFKAADGGVLFLDEIAELPASAQAKLLRVLQEGVFEPLGTNESVRVNVRIISATHRNLQERIVAGLFREDLFYRINVIEIRVPPLRERAADLPSLVQHFLRRFAPKELPVPAISPAAWASLLRYDYPGNVRELSGGQEIDVPHRPPAIAGTDGAASLFSVSESSAIRPLYPALRDFERQYLRQALKANQGSRARTAAMLGISRKTLWEKLRGDGVDGRAATDDHDIPAG